MFRAYLSFPAGTSSEIEPKGSIKGWNGPPVASFPQPHASTAAVLGNELDASLLKSQPQQFPVGISHLAAFSKALIETALIDTRPGKISCDHGAECAACPARRLCEGLNNEKADTSDGTGGVDLCKGASQTSAVEPYTD